MRRRPAIDSLETTGAGIWQPKSFGRSSKIDISGTERLKICIACCLK